VDLTELDQEAGIELLEISGWNLAAPLETLYLAASPGVSFDGQAYDSIPFSSSGFDLIGQGTPPAPEIVIANLGQIVSNWLYQCKQTGYRLEGARVKRRFTKRKYLDGQPSAGAAIKEDPYHVFYLEQVSENRREVSASLIDPFNRQGETLPNRPALRVCPWQYRWTECGYNGGAMFDQLNQPTLDPKADRCSKTVDGCQKRFPNQDLPHGGFPGLQSF
jgi:lambda family phage minor tail protein L